MDFRPSFGFWLKTRRKKLDLTQAELADCAGCTVATIRKIEAELRRPSRQIAELLAGCLQIPAEQRSLFVQVARGERGVDRLGAAAATSDGPPAPEHQRPSPRWKPPAPSTPLLGREQELATITQLLAEPPCRLLTLVGPGGIGKTRLALAAADRLQPTFAHGAAFVLLAAITGREPLVSATAEALGLVLYSATDRAEQLIQALQDKTLLLVLDNYEHLLADDPCVALVKDLLQTLPTLKLLITSREPLRLQTEWVFEVQGLPLPTDAGIDALEASSAARLFLQRARQARVDFILTSADQPAVLKICQLVAGLPLGIELAAAWVLAMSCQAIAQEIEGGLEFLVAASRDIPDRHRSISAVFDHSWTLLTPLEQQVLSRLAIFQGGFNREAAEAVAGASLPVLTALVTKSLLRRTNSAADRYDLHELVRQYALAHLQADEPAYRQARDRHCRYYAALLEGQGSALKGADRPAAISMLVAELANLRLAWDWAITQAFAPAISQAADTLFWLYESRSNCREGVTLFGQAVQRLQADSDEESACQLALGQALNYQGFFCFRQGQQARGIALLQRSHTLLHTLPDDQTGPIHAALADAAVFLGTATSAGGDYAAGYRLLTEGLSLQRDRGNRWGMAFGLRQLGLAAHEVGEYREAYRLLAESLSLSRQLGNTWAIAASLNALGTTSLALEAYDEAQACLTEGLALSQRLEDRYNIAVGLSGLGRISQALERYEEAQRYFHESTALWREIGTQSELAGTLNSLGETLRQMGDRASARRCFHEALTIATETQVTPVMLEAVLGFAALRLEEHAPEAALTLVRAVLQHPAGAHKTKDRARQLLAEIEDSLTLMQAASVDSHGMADSFETLVADLLYSPTSGSLRSSSR
jgi:predicted ATPase/transcriptional regulator with XRE-family HTH domain